MKEWFWDDYCAWIDNRATFIFDDDRNPSQYKHEYDLIRLLEDLKIIYLRYE